MYSKLANHTSVRKQAGDTIVEVLLALAVLGAVLGGAYVVTNRNMVINQASQERSQAVKIAESQLEQVRNVFETDYESVVALSTNPFCMSGSSIVSGSGMTTSCKIDAAGSPTTSEPAYVVAINPTDQTTSDGFTAKRFEITVTWANRTGTNDTFSYLYEMYR